MWPCFSMSVIETLLFVATPGSSLNSVENPHTFFCSWQIDYLARCWDHRDIRNSVLTNQLDRSYVYAVVSLLAAILLEARRNLTL